MDLPNFFCAALFLKILEWDEELIENEQIYTDTYGVAPLKGDDFPLII